MRRAGIQHIFGLALLLVTGAMAPAQAVSVAEPQQAAAEQPASTSKDALAELVRKVRAAPDQFSYADLSLAVAGEIYPGLAGEKAAAFRKDVDALAAKVRDSLKPEQPAQEKVARANAAIYQHGGMKCAESTPPEQERPDFYFPHATWERKKGVCLGLTALYLCVAEKAGLPMYAMHAPQHIFVRYDDTKEQVNVETTDGGRVFEVSAYLTRFKAEDRERLKEVYFKRLDKVEVLGDLLNAAAWCSAIETAPKPLPPERALLAARLCVEIGPQDYNNWDTLAQACAYAGNPKQALEAIRKAVAMRPPAVGSYDERYWESRLKRFSEAEAKARK